MMQGHEEPPSVAQLRRLFYPSHADKHEEGKGKVPPLLPFSDEGQAERWAQADLESQLLLAQVVRQAILPWYARITQDRDFIFEIVIALRSALQVAFRAASTSSGTSSSVLSLFVSEELPALLIQHYREYRRASDVYPSFESPKGWPTATQVYLASNPHPALSVSRQGRLHVSEAYLDSLLQSLLEALLPVEQSSSEAQVAILKDVIKGSITNQLRIRGRGAWVLVRAVGQVMGRDLEVSSSSSSQASSSLPSQTAQEHAVDIGSIATSLLHGLYALASMLMPLVVRSYLDLFTPNAELRRSSEAPARGSRLRQKRAAANGSSSGRSTSSKSSVVSILPTVHLAMEALELPKRALGSFVVWICQLSALWHLDQSIARRIEEQAVEFLTPNKVAEWIRLAREALVESQNQPPPPPAVEPPLLVQQREYDELVRLLSHRVSVYPPSHQVLLGMTEDARRKSIKRALDPFLSPAPRQTSEAHEADLIDLHDGDGDDDDREQPSSLTEVAGTRLLLCVSERVLAMLDPSLAA